MPVTSAHAYGTWHARIQERRANKFSCESRDFKTLVHTVCSAPGSARGAAETVISNRFYTCQKHSYQPEGGGESKSISSRLAAAAIAVAEGIMAFAFYSLWQ